MIFSRVFYIFQQILVPESQFSPVEEEPLSLKEKSNPKKEIAKYIKSSREEDKKYSQVEVNMVSK